MHGTDRRLELVRAGSLHRQRLAQERVALARPFTIPATTILVLEQVEAELAAIEEALGHEAGRWSELLTPGYRRALLIGVMLAVFGQLSGINAVMYYAPVIFESSGAELDAAFVQTVSVEYVPSSCLFRSTRVSPASGCATGK